mmetsp:Transcript_3321/g.7860  ORF Transcript_3321/g.7860 Transcript_3321/m.7860 type:complete len:283 (-) Transcript_3321:85-933(-)
MTARRLVYQPPNGGLETRQRRQLSSASIDAAAALNLLECDPSSVLWPRPASKESTGGACSSFDASRPSGIQAHKSAAKAAREKYAEALAAKARATPMDLLDLGSSPASGSSQAPAAVPALRAVTAPRVEDTQTSSDGVSWVWAGDTVLARWGQGDRFSRARVIRVYSRAGAAQVDVEWLEPQATDCGRQRHCHGLLVAQDIRRLSQDVADVGLPARPPVAPVAPGVAEPRPEEREVAEVHDLLDLDGHQGQVVPDVDDRPGGGRPFSPSSSAQAAHGGASLL